MEQDSAVNFKLPDKFPPQSVEAEKCLLGALMLDQSAILRVVDFLEARDFYKGTHQEIYQVMVDLFTKGEPIDLLSVSNRLKEKDQLETIGGNAYLTELINSVPTAAHSLNYAKIVQRKRTLRDLIDASHEIGIMGYNETEDIEVLLDKAEKRIFSIAQKSLNQDFLPVKAALEEAFERIDRLSKHKGGPRGIPTGFFGLDNLLSGLQKSDLIILASRPTMGKSALSLDFARNIAVNEGIPVGIFSLEMSRDQVVDRLISSQANVDLWKLRTGRLSSEGGNNDFSQIQQALGVLSEAPIYIDDAAAPNILQMRAMARRLQAAKGLGLIIVDYIQLIDPRNPATSPVQQMTEISRSLKALARELNTPVLAISQLSRAVEQRSPQIPRLSDLRESGCVTGDTQILRADTGELIPIKDLVGQTSIPIFTLTEDFKLKKSIISKVFPSGKKLVYLLKTLTGRNIKASANHPFRKLEGWVKLDELKIGDRIALPRLLPRIEKPIELKEEKIILLAHLMGDGCYLKKQPLHYTSGDKASIDLISAVAKKAFPEIRPKIVNQENWWHVYLPGKDKIKQRENPINIWLRELGIFNQRSYQKTIPNIIFRLTNSQIALFFKHLWSTDGEINIRKYRGNKNQFRIYYSSTSPTLIYQLQHLLLRLGIISQISSFQKKGYRPNYLLNIQGKNNQLKFLETVGIFGQKSKIAKKMVKTLEKISTNPNCDVIPKEIWQEISIIKTDYHLSWRDFAKNLNTAYCGSTLFKNGVSRTRLERILTFLPELKLKNLASSDIYWDEIISITPLKTLEVYDATVPETHNFLANDIIIHNSIEQDADVVMFIYREDHYRPESSKQNITDVIVAKHRNGPVGKIELYFDKRRVTFRNLEKEYQE